MKKILFLAALALLASCQKTMTTPLKMRTEKSKIKPYKTSLPAIKTAGSSPI